MRRARLILARHRRLLAALLAGIAAVCALHRLAPPRGVPVLAAARDLPGGRLSASDVTVVRLPPDALPDGVLRPGTPVAGRVVAGPMRRGEPITDVRLLGPGILRAQGQGLVATPVRIADARVAELLSPGDVVDVLAAFDGAALGGAYPDGAASGGTAAPASAPVARQVRVLARPPGGDGEGALLVLATTVDQAARLAHAQAHGRLAVAIHPR
jgi:pilus assembly protein CpaB